MLSCIKFHRNVGKRKSLGLGNWRFKQLYSSITIFYFSLNFFWLFDYFVNEEYVVVEDLGFNCKKELILKKFIKMELRRHIIV